MRRLRLVLASPLLLAFISVACKQEIGQRCEQPSDCASGYCGGSSTINDMTSAEGHICSSGPPPPVPMNDAAPASDASSTGDAAAEASASEAGGDTPSEAGDAAAEGATDASAPEAGADASDAAGDSGADAPAGG